MSRFANSNVWVRKTHEKPFGGRGIRIRYVNGKRVVEANSPQAAKLSFIQDELRKYAEAGKMPDATDATTKPAA